MIPIKQSLFLFICLLTGVINLYSQNEITSHNFIRSKDVFGTRTFIENKGQFDKSIKKQDKIYYAFENGEEKVYFTTKGLVYKITKRQNISHDMLEAMEHGEKVELEPDETYFIEMNWLNANQDIRIEKDKNQSNYFTYGDPKLNSYGYKKITYKNVYNGIDFEYIIPESKEYGIKYNIIVHPGADPTVIKMAYGGDFKKLMLTSSGDIIIKTPKDNITEHIPVTFDQHNKPVPSSFTVYKNIISFKFPEGYDNTKDLIIDPWITTSTSLTSTNYGFDIDYDFSGNVYVYGGTDPYKLSKYDSNGNLLWTFNGTLSSPYWTSGIYAGNFVVNKSNGKCYIGQGYNPYGTTIIRITSNGNYDNFITASNPNWNECWDMGFHCVTGNIYAFGGGQSGNLAAGIINQITASVLPTAFFPNNPLHGQDIASHAIDDQGNVFVYYSQGTNPSYLLNNRIVLLNPTLSGAIWNQPSTYNTLTECQNKSQLIGSGFTPGINSSTGFNCLAVNSNYLFFYDGLNLAAYDKLTGLKKASTIISGNNPLQQGGIAVDDCNNVYIGGHDHILSFQFNDSIFNPNPSINLSDTIGDKYIFDIRLEKATNLLYVSGSGFIGTFNALPCNYGTGNTITNNLKICKGSTLQLNALPSSSYLWSGPNGFSSTLQNPTLANITSSMVGTYSVITAPSFCSSSTLAITNVKIDSIAVSITANPNIGFAPLSVQFTNTTTIQNTNTGYVTYNWNYGNGLYTSNISSSALCLINGIPNGNTVYQSAGNYITHLTIVQKTGSITCVGTASTLVKVDLPSNIEIPNTFTPNGDGVNDVFSLQTTNLTEITCLIYDRWGVKMHDVTSEKGNIAWDGKNLGNKDVPAGTYFYIIKAKGKDSREYEYKGTISLFR